MPDLISDLFCFEFRMDYHTTDIGGNVGAVDFEECHQKCAANVECYYFTYLESACFLKTDGVLTKSSLEKAVSGPKICNSTI